MALMYRYCLWLGLRYHASISDAACIFARAPLAEHTVCSHIVVRAAQDRGCAVIW